jgi:dolichol-phosphate mannosyltransferase
MVLDVPNVCVVIPTLNEAGTIGKLIESIEELVSFIQVRIIIVDDGSKDGTQETVEAMNENHGNIIIVERGRKLGFGSALIDGFRTALKLEPEPDFIVTMDADLSHDPREIPHLIKSSEADSLVVGSRYVKGGEIHGWGLYRKTVSKVANFLTRFFINLPAKDCTSGFRSYDIDLIKKILPYLESKGYDIQIEVLFRAVRNGFSVVEEPIIFKNRQSGGSKLTFGELFGFARKIYTLRALSRI